MYIMIRIGLVNMDTSHPLAFSNFLHSENRARYTAIYNDGFRGDDEVDSFIKKAGLEARAGSIEELAEMTDVGFIQDCNWNKHLKHALPFISRGKPVFIDKPVVGSFADCEELVRIAEDGAVILGSSSIRYCAEVSEFLAQPADERGEILHVYGTSGNDEFNYAIHIVETISGLIGLGAEACSFCSSAEASGIKAETYHIDYPDGRAATYTTCLNQGQPFVLVIMTTKMIKQICVDTTSVYKTLLNRICDYMETGVNRLASVQALIEPVKIMLAGKVSRENGGSRIPLSSLSQYKPAFDGDAFEKAYSAAAAKLYL